MIAQPGRSGGHHGWWLDPHGRWGAGRPATAPQRSLARTRLHAATSWPARPLSRAVLLLALLAGGFLVAAARWAPSVFLAGEPAVWLLLALFFVALAFLASGPEAG